MSHRTDLHVVLYGDQNANLVDGSSIWLQSTAVVLASLGFERLELVLKAPVERDILVGDLRATPGLELVETDEELTSAAAAEKVAAREPDIVVVRGSRVALEMARLRALRGRLWTYLTDIPQHPLVVTEEQLAEIITIVEASEVLLCQTDGLRGHLETMVPAACGRTALYPPMLPLETMPRRTRQLGVPVRLAYAGKFAPRWRTMEMTRLPERFGAADIPVEVEFIGDKIHRGEAEPDWRPRMQAALEQSGGVRWIGALPREDTFARLTEADFGLAWRDPNLDASLELSTKLLEYGALGLPALLNRTDDHAALLGADYPLFVEDEEDVVAAVAACVADPTIHELAVDRLAAAAEQHSFGAARERLAWLLARRRPKPERGVGRPVRVLVVGHDLKFFEHLDAYLDVLPSVDLRHDHWEELLTHDHEASRQALEDAEVVFCEWAGPAAVWCSRHVRDDQRLVVRLHRFEMYRDWPSELRMDAVDMVVCVNDHYRRMALRELGWPSDKVVTIPNYVDHLDLDRPKLPDAAFRIGMIGITPMRKRFDLGLELLARLRRIDRRFSLVAKSKLPEEHEWIWINPDERRHARDVHRRLAQDPDLRDAVHVDRFGPDVAHWLRRVGWVVSTSEDESFHLATAEGMASGAVPVLRDWEGVEGIYDGRWIHESLDAMVDHIARHTLDGTWAELAREAKAESRPWDVTAVARRFEAVLLG